jgi:3-hydroxyacyl-CoA dehydrogenase/enoyl-CoA hydratase/3-hydroxybutyryl-CoA epimerase
LSALPCPTVMLIEGFCLGGGFELALSCQYRIAADDPQTQVGLPEINIGVHPGWGGSVRLPRRVGVFAAMEMILSGRVFDARTAKQKGYIDACVPKRQLERAARGFIFAPPKIQSLPYWLQIINAPWARPWVGKILLKKVQQKGVRPEQYPAPFAVINNWIEVDSSGERAFAREIQSMSEMFLTSTAKNLLNLFFMRERLRTLSKQTEIAISHVHVVGAGVMGTGIATQCVAKGLMVSLQDTNRVQLAKALQHASDHFRKKFKRSADYRAAMDRFIIDESGMLLAKADVVVEAVFEDIAVKQKMFQWLEAHARPDALLATNTSSIPLEKISAALHTPARLVGVHFFNPVEKMILVEVIQSADTDPHAIQTANAFCGKIGMLPLPVHSYPGFLVNRILMPYLLEAMELVQEGVPITQIDEAAVAFGMPLGPVELADRVGLDICLHVSKILQGEEAEISEVLQEKVKQGNVGAKSGQGFYRYVNGKKQSLPKPPSAFASDLTLQEIQDRLIFRMLAEAAFCLENKIVSDHELLDAGMVFATGFAPFRGGLMSYAKSLGAHTVSEKFTQLSSKFGERFNSEVEWDHVL